VTQNEDCRNVQARRRVISLSERREHTGVRSREARAEQIQPLGIIVELATGSGAPRDQSSIGLQREHRVAFAYPLGGSRVRWRGWTLAMTTTGPGIKSIGSAHYGLDAEPQSGGQIGAVE